MICLVVMYCDSFGAHVPIFFVAFTMDLLFGKTAYGPLQLNVSMKVILRYDKPNKALVKKKENPKN